MEPVGVDGGEAEPALVDLTGLPLPELFASDDSVLANSLRRLLADLDRPQDIIAGFGNSVGRSPSD
jgi:FXSXX-COOH protein